VVDGLYYTAELRCSKWHVCAGLKERWDGIRNLDIRRRIGWIHDINQRLQQRQLCYFGHVTWMSRNRYLKQASASGKESWEMIQDAWKNPDPLQKLIDLSLGHAPPLQKFQQDLFVSFWVFCAQTHRNTDCYENNQIGGGNDSCCTDMSDDVTVHLVCLNVVCLLQRSCSCGRSLKKTSGRLPWWKLLASFGHIDPHTVLILVWHLLTVCAWDSLCKTGLVCCSRFGYVDQHGLLAVSRFAHWDRHSSQMLLCDAANAIINC